MQGGTRQSMDAFGDERPAYHRWLKLKLASQRSF